VTRRPYQIDRRRASGAERDEMTIECNGRRKIEAGPPRQANTKADVLRRALAQLEQARTIASAESTDGPESGEPTA
jgi:hypothetical protein